MSSNHLQFDRMINSAASGDLKFQFSEQAERHLQECPQCRQQLEQIAAEADWWQKASDFLQDDLADVELPEWKPNLEMTSVATVQSQDTLEEVTHQAILDPAKHPEMLGRIGQYDIEEVIGRGGMGVVYKGYDNTLNRSIAIKVLSPHLASNGTARKRFAREARAAAGVVHAHVIPIHLVAADAKLPYIVMPLMAGQSLQEYVDQHGPLDTKDVVRISLQIAAGLQAAHKHGLVHRDIKPANILMEQDVSRVMISDFGLARAADDAAMTQTGWLAGTPYYMSPEQSKGRDVSHSSDLFSLGSVMYFMATGRVPFRGDSPMAVLNQICTEPHSPARQVNSDVPRELAGIVDRLLEKKPTDRFRSAEQLHNSLEEYLVYLQHPEKGRKPRAYTSSAKLRRRSFGLAGAAVVMMLATLGYLSTTISLGGDTPAVTPSEKNSPEQQQAHSITPSPQSFELLRNLMGDDDFQQKLSDLERDLLFYNWDSQGNSQGSSSGPPTSYSMNSKEEVRDQLTNQLPASPESAPTINQDRFDSIPKDSPNETENRQNNN